MVSASMATRMPSLSPQTALVGAVVLVAVVFIWQGTYLFSVWRGEGMDGARLTIRAAGSSGSGIGLEQVAKLHLFGEKAQEPVDVVPAQTEIPQTDLKFVLVGAMTNSDATKASALIATDKQTSRFFVGDSIATGVVLQEVHADAVVLKRNGKLETLSFPRASESTVSTPRRGGVGLSDNFMRPVPVNSPANRGLNAGPRANIRPAGALPAQRDR